MHVQIFLFNKGYLSKKVSWQLPTQLLRPWYSLPLELRNNAERILFVFSFPIVWFISLSFADEKFVACTCNVGDSLAYVYSPSQGHVREITQGSHDIQSNRDMRDALGMYYLMYVLLRYTKCKQTAENM